MKRHVRMIVVLLLCGAIVNVAVAWGCVQFHGHTWRDGWIQTTKDEQFWSECAPRAIAKLKLTQPPYLAKRFGVTAEIMCASNVGSLQLVQRDALWKMMSAGWPMPSLDGEAWYWARTFGGGVDLHSAGSFVVSPKYAHQFPMRPIWPGFAINTIFYAVIVWLVFFAPFVLRRWRRIKRGLCMKCGYDLRGRAPQSTVCPECETSLPSPSLLLRGRGVGGEGASK